mgnify:CR=1 FL=1
MRSTSSRPLMSGLSTSTWRSKRPGRSSAGSSTSGAVGGAHDDDALSRVEAVHLGQQLVQRLLALFVTAHRALHADLAQRVELVDEHDAGRFRLRPARRDRGRARRRRRRTSRRTPTRSGEKNGTFASPATARASSVLPVPGGPTSSTPFGMRPPSVVYFFGVPQELDDLLQLVLGLVHARHVAGSSPSRHRRRRSSRGCARTT